MQGHFDKDVTAKHAPCDTDLDGGVGGHFTEVLRYLHIEAGVGQQLGVAQQAVYLGTVHGGVDGD